MNILSGNNRLNYCLRTFKTENNGFNGNISLNFKLNIITICFKSDWRWENNKEVKNIWRIFE